MRNNPRMQSRDGHVRYDLDITPRRWVIHLYKVNHSRDMQFLMTVEVKTFGADLDLAQQDTLSILSQCLRNRRRTKNKQSIPKQIQPIINSVYSHVLKRRVKIRLFGAHLLQFSGAGPEDSEHIFWDRKEITIDQMEALLKFEIDPDTFKGMDLRIHHQAQYPIFEQSMLEISNV